MARAIHSMQGVKDHCSASVWSITPPDNYTHGLTCLSRNLCLVCVQRAVNKCYRAFEWISERKAGAHSELATKPLHFVSAPTLPCIIKDVTISLGGEKKKTLYADNLWCVIQQEMIFQSPQGEEKVKLGISKYHFNLQVPLTQLRIFKLS